MERNISLNNLQSNVTAIELDWCVCRRLLLQTTHVLYSLAISKTLSHYRQGKANPRTATAGYSPRGRLRILRTCIPVACFHASHARSSAPRTSTRSSILLQETPQSR
jgi:hypothetical protein